MVRMSEKERHSKSSTATADTAARASSTALEKGGDRSRFSQPELHQHGREIQEFGTLVRMPLGLDEGVCRQSVESLNQVLADTLTLRDLYKKHHWQVSGPTFAQLHLLFDKHYEEQLALIDELGERVQQLGGISVVMGADVAETTMIPRPPKGREEPPVEIARLLEAHEIILKNSHEAARQADEGGDDGTNDLLISEVIRVNEKQAWFLAEHLVDTPLVHSESSESEM